MNKRSLENVPGRNRERLKIPAGTGVYINEDGKRIRAVVIEEYPYMVLCRNVETGRRIGVSKNNFLCGEAYTI